MTIAKATAAFLTLAALAAGCAFAAAWTLKPAPKTPPMFPTYAQVTEAGTVLTHDLDISFQSLASAPDFVLCDHTPQRTYGGVTRCVFLTTFSDDTSSYYAVWLDRADRPVWAEKLKGLPTPPAA